MFELNISYSIEDITDCLETDGKPIETENSSGKLDKQQKENNFKLNDQLISLLQKVK